MMVRTFLLGASSALALAACGQSSTEGGVTTAPVAGVPTAGGPVVVPTPALPTPAAFVQMAANSDAFEIQSSQLAATRSARAEVKSFATMMVHDHGATTRELTALAPRANLAAPSAMLDEDHQNKLERLRGLRGADFDDAYLDIQTEAHTQAVQAFTDFSDNAEAGPLRDWAAQTLTKLQAHLDQAHQLDSAT